MTPTRRTAALVLTLGLAAVAGAGGAQGGSPSPLFSRLTEAERQLLLAAVGVSGAENFLPGQLPASLPYRPPALPGQTVVGTVVQPDASIAVVRTSSGDAAAHAAALEALRRDGWRDLYSRSSAREVFQTSPLGTSRVFYPLCKPGLPGNLTVTSFPLGAGQGTQVTYRYGTFSGAGGRCPADLGQFDPVQANHYEPARDRTFRDPWQELLDSGVKVPVLAAPAGAEVEPSGSRWDMSSFDTYVKVFTPQTAAQVREHYVRALQAQGWRLGSVQTLNGEQITRFVYRQGQQDREGVLSLMPRPGLGRTQAGVALNRYDVQLRLTYR